MPRYPSLNIGSINILHKRLSANKEDEIQKNKELFEYCFENFDTLWRDSSASQPEKDKWIRSCKNSRLERTLDKIDKILLKPFDRTLPAFIHGGVSGEFQKINGAIVPKCSQSAAVSLIDGKKGRWLLHMDLQRFFEQVTQERVITLFHSKFKCSRQVAFIISELCCVREGSKKNPLIQNKKTIARGFAPSVRLAIWCNLNFFYDLKRLIEKELRSHFPKIVIFVDDIGITAVNVDRKKLEEIMGKVIRLAEKHGLNVNISKTKITAPTDLREYAGSHLGNKKIFPSTKITKKRLNRLRQLKESPFKNREKIRASLKGLNQHRKFTKKVSLS